MAKFMIEVLFGILLNLTAFAAPPSTMEKLSDTLKQLLKLSSEDLKWQDLKEEAKIDALFRSFLSFSHEIKLPAGTLGEDPSLTLLAPALSDQIRLTRSAYRLHHYQFARESLRTITETCFACHSKEAELRPFLNSNGAAEFKFLTTIERARLLVATRQTDQALETYAKIIWNEEGGTPDWITWNHALKESLTLLIRVKRDAKRALEFIEPILRSKATPYFYKPELEGWKKQLLEWRKEENKSPDSEQSLLKEIHRLFARALKLKRFPLDHSADVQFLRASSLLFEFIRKYPKSENLSEALILQGTAYETLDQSPIGNLNEIFFEACIRNLPHTRQALQCYERLEKSIYYGFTGSRGTLIPLEYKNKLLELWGLSYLPDTLQH